MRRLRTDASRQRWQTGMTLTQNGGVNYICHHPGGVKSLSFNRDTGAMTCSEYVEKEAVCGDE